MTEALPQLPVTKGQECDRCGSTNTENCYPIWFCCLNCGFFYGPVEQDNAVVQYEKSLEKKA